MTNQVVLTGIILSVSLVGDYDKRFVLLTKERGKVTVFARGARRQKSNIMAVTEAFTYGRFTLFEGRDAYSFVSAEIDEYFMAIKEDLQAVAYASYFTEFAEHLTRENLNEKNILKLLYQTLRVLGTKIIDYSLIKCIYEIKLLAYYGLQMQVFQCVSCEKEGENFVFRADKGGICCPNCTRVSSKESFLNTSTVYTLQYIISSSIEKLYSFRVTAEVQKELEVICKEYIKEYVDRKFRSLEFLECIESLS